MKTFLAIHHSYEPASDAQPYIDLAQERGAHLDMLVVGAMPSVAATAYPGMVDIYSSKSHKEITEDAKRTADALEALIQNSGISASVSVECREFPLIDEAVPGHAMFSDATVFRNNSVLDDDVMTRCFNSVLLKSGRPALLLGKGDKLPTEINRVLFAWNGEPESAKAIHQAMGWLNPGSKVNVVVVDPDEYRFGPNPGDDAASYLARQGYEVAVDRLPGRGRDVSDILLEHAVDIDAELIVMGAYGHSRFRQWLLGGTTRSILSQSRLPVLMAK